MSEQKITAAVTAGMRGASWNPRLMTRAYDMVPYPLGTADKQRTLGFLYTTTGKEKTVVTIMHPREMSVTHYLVPWILDSGCACWVQAPRSIGSDLRLEHEVALFDVAAGMNHLRELGYEHIVQLGNSGGAGLYAFYNEQARLAPEERLQRTVAGRPVRLAELNMPVADGMIFVSPHPGQGLLLMNGIDPSVVDENDPMLTDETLNPFSKKNGFDTETMQGNYSAEFIARYQAAQRQRVERIDAIARALVAKKMTARKKGKQGNPTILERQTAAYGNIFNVWRTDADLRAWDLSLDPSDRAPGSLWGNNPFVSNWGSVGFGRVVTPESWLSTWSGISSKASFVGCAPSIQQPALLIEYTGDQCTFPKEIKQGFDAIGSSNKKHLRVRGNHHGMALSPDEPSGQEIAGQHIRTWLNEQFN